MTDQEKAACKDKILTDFFKSGLLETEVKKMCARNRIHHAAYIHEDVISETFYYLSRLNPDYIINVHEQGPRNFLGLACDIAIKKGFSKDKKNPLYHKHSLALNILFASNLNTCETVSETGEFDSDEGGRNDKSFKVLLATDPEEVNEVEELWNMIKSELSKSEIQFLNRLMYGKKKRGRYKNSVKERRDRLFEKIKSIVERHKIHI